MSIEEIMKPYFDKIEEISKRPDNYKYEQDSIINRYQEETKKYRLENEAYENEMLALKTRLQTLRNNRNSEIEEYVKNAVSERPDFYVGYGAMIRKDLEQEYLKREKSLELEIIALSDKINDNYLKIAENNKLITAADNSKLSEKSIHRVDVHELVDLKHDLRKVLISTKKELESKLQASELRFDAVMYKLTTFKYEYNENHVAINGSEYRKLFEESNRLIEVKYNLQSEIKKLDENLKLTELTEEEIKVIMMSMTDLERKEYDNRKKVNSIISTVEQLTSQKFEDQPQNTSNSLESDTKTGPKRAEDFKIEEINSSEPFKDSRIYETTRKGLEEQQRFKQNYSEFIKEISTDVLMSVKKLRSVKVEDGKYLTVSSPDKETENYMLEDNSSEEKVQLVNGIYLNKSDVFKALNNYVRKNKGQSFKVKGISETLTVTKKSLKVVKEYLRECTIKKLFSEKKLSSFDIRRVFGQEQMEKYLNNPDSNSKKSKMPSGDYVLRTDVHDALKRLFVEKKPTWFENFKSKYIEKVTDAIEYSENEESLPIDAEYEVVKTK